jgi:hypothetical protein
MKMEQLPKIARQRLQVTAKPGVHPDPDLLAAFVEKSLDKRERTRVLEHLAQCGDCREVVALAIPESEVSQTVVAHRRSGWLRGSVLRWGALATCVVVVGAAVTLRQQKRETAMPRVAEEQSAPAALADKVTRDGKVSQTAGNKLAANANADERPEPELRLETDMAARQQARQVDQAASASGNLRSLQSAPERSKDELSAASRLPAGETAPAPSEASKVAELDKRENQKKEQPGEELQSHVATANDETGVITGGTSSAGDLAEATPAKAKSDARVRSLEPKTGAAVGGIMGATSQMAASPPAEKYAVQRGRAKLIPRWTLTSDGRLLRSLDSGKTWETISVASHAEFRALAAVASEIWVGGAGGALYHSSDAGQNWTQVKPVADSQSLTADIIGVEFTDAQHGKLTTADQETWTTADAGQTWQKK